MAYHIKSKKSDVNLEYLPRKATLKDGTEVELVVYEDKHEKEVHEILRYIVNEEGKYMSVYSFIIYEGNDANVTSYREEEEKKDLDKNDSYTNIKRLLCHQMTKFLFFCTGDSYPQEDMTTTKDFRAYYLTHDVYVCLDKKTEEVLGAFYIKPNFPGRCSHICNAGFIVKVSARGRGVGTFMVENYLQIAKDLGYRASFFNLVFVTNESSIKLWRKFGFKEIGRVPNAGNLKGRGYTDALQFYYDLTQ